MAVEPNNANSGLSVDLGDELSKNITVHKNVKQDVILTTVDKVKLVLMETEKYSASRRDWLTPLGLALSFVTTLCTSEFKDSFGVKKELWHALFLLLTLASIIWLFFTLYRLIMGWGKGSLNNIIKQIQLTQENTP